MKFLSHPDISTVKGGPTSTGLTHIAFTVSDIFETLARFREFGYGTEADPQPSADGEVLMCYADAPENMIVELVQPSNGC